MRFQNSLDQLIASIGHLAVLRALWKNQRTELTGRALARASGLSTAQTARVLIGLQDEGLALSRVAGRAFLWRWNEAHYWGRQLSAMFEFEADARRQLVEDLRVVFRDVPVRRVRLFGSVASGDERVDSDVDLFVETKDARATQRVREALGTRSRFMWEKYGNPVAPLILTTTEVGSLRNKKLLRSITETGIEIASGP
jgi:predicted nucleotidyltransferase